MIPMTAAEVDWLRPRHYAHPDKPGRCHWCDEDWPCNTARLIVTLDEARVDDVIARMRRLELFGGDGEEHLSVAVATRDAEALRTFLDTFDVGDVYVDVMPRLLAREYAKEA